MIKYIIWLFIYINVNKVVGERLHEQIYSSIEGSSACFRRLNGTHQAGCSSASSGSVGVVQMVNNRSDAEWIVFNSTEVSNMAVVSTSLFQSVIEIFLENPQRVGGILLYENANETHVFSQESQCPNEYSSAPESQCSSSERGSFTWNSIGTGLIRRNIPFPIFFVPKSHFDEISKIKSCYERFNLDRDNQNSRPLCSLQLNSFMYAAVNSEVCLRRSAISTLMNSAKMCDILGDQNVYYSLFPRNKERQGGDVTLVTARIDTASLFDGLSPGAASSVVGLVTLIAAATTLAKMIPIADADKYKTNVIWTLLNGEAFDYIGSQRIAYDISRGVWPPNAPLSTSQIDMHLELGQIGGSLNAFSDKTTWPFYAFMPYETNDVPKEINMFSTLLKDVMREYNLSLTNKITKNLPPSSLHSFRRILKNGTDRVDIPELLLVDHETSFTNNFYHSVLDDERSIGFTYRNISIDDKGTFIDTNDLIRKGIMTENDIQVKIAKLATSVSQALYTKITGLTPNGEASAHLVDEMLYCFISSQSCRLLAAAEFGSAQPEALNPQPAPLFVSVAIWLGTAPVFAGHLLALLTGEDMKLNKTVCSALKDSNYNHYWLRGWNNSGVCIRTTMNFTQAISPAFLIDNYDLKSGEYSTWTESVWQGISARVFVSSSGTGAVLAAVIGVLVTVLVAGATYWLKTHHDIIFPLPTPANVVTANSDVTTGILRTVNC